MDAVSQLLIEDAPRGTWKSIEPATITGAEGTTFTPQPDGFILAGVGNAAPETYSIEGHAAVKRIAALKLDVTPHPSLPNGSTAIISELSRHRSSRARVRRADGTNQVSLCAMPLQIMSGRSTDTQHPAMVHGCT